MASSSSAVSVAKTKALKTYPTARRDHNRAINKKSTRDRINGAILLQGLAKIDVELGELNNAVKNAKNSKENPDNVNLVIAKSLTRTKILKTRADLKFRKLAKILPDLKAIDLTSGGKGLKPFPFTMDISGTTLEGEIEDNG